MKIYVNEMPTKPEQCLFVDKRRAYNDNKIPFDLYKCVLDKKDCKINCGGSCNKLRVLHTY